ncbi:MAG: hypothetical protein M0C28_03805 [Candidatus Moduliflexus flocculans]|nr:hypothetical protein [Candidatus Moduliflexus flocculans]
MLPKGRRAEAEDAFVTAVRELELALEAEPNNVRAHRTLARVHSLRKNHAAAAEHYRRPDGDRSLRRRCLRPGGRLARRGRAIRRSPDRARAGQGPHGRRPGRFSC